MLCCGIHLGSQSMMISNLITLLCRCGTRCCLDEPGVLALHEWVGTKQKQRLRHAGLLGGNGLQDRTKGHGQLLFLRLLACC